MRTDCTTALLAGMWAGLFGGTALALPPFNAAWLDRYKAASTDAKFLETVEAVKCNVCHLGRNRANKNAYGKAVGKYLSKKDYDAIKSDPDKSKAYVVEGLFRADSGKDAKGRTFGERLAAGDLPQEP